MLLKRNAYFFDLDDTILLVDGPPHKDSSCKPNLPMQAVFQTIAEGKYNDVFIITGRAERLREKTEDQICRLVYRGLYMAQRGEDGKTPPGHISKPAMLQDFINQHRGEYENFYIVDNDPEACVAYNQIPEVCVLNFWPKIR